MAKDNSISPDELIQQVKDDLGETVDTLLEACEEFYMHGFSDQVSGNVDSPQGHFYRVHRWIVTCDGRFNNLDEYDNEDEAEAAFDEINRQYCEWDDGE